MTELGARAPPFPHRHPGEGRDLRQGFRYLLASQFSIRGFVNPIISADRQDFDLETAPWTTKYPTQAVVGDAMNWLDSMGSVSTWLTLNNWPIVALIVAFLFRSDVKGLTTGVLSMSDRIMRLGPLELRAQEGPQASALSTGESMFDPKSIDVLDNDASLRPFYDHFAKLISESTINNQERYARAVRAWAFTVRARVFDDIARTIFGTQVAALRKLAQQPADKRGIRNLHSMHQQLAAAEGVTNEKLMDFDEWLNFPMSKELIAKGERGKFQLTELGSAFLAHLDSEGASRPIPL